MARTTEGCYLLTETWCNTRSGLTLEIQACTLRPGTIVPQATTTIGCAGFGREHQSHTLLCNKRVKPQAAVPQSIIFLSCDSICRQRPQLSCTLLKARDAMHPTAWTLNTCYYLPKSPHWEGMWHKIEFYVRNLSMYIEARYKISPVLVGCVGTNPSL